MESFEEHSMIHRIIFLGIFLVLLVSRSFSVTPETFKTCQDSGFSRRNRRLADLIEGGQKQDPSLPIFHIRDGSIEMFPDHIEAILQDKRDTSIDYIFRIYLSEKGLIRIKIEEKDSLRPRYEIKDVIINYGKATEYTRQRDTEGIDSAQKNEEAHFSHFLFDECELLLRHDPFRMDFLYEGMHVISINSRGLMNFEPALRGLLYRSNQARDESNRTSSWEETWKGHVDQILYGPVLVGMDFTFIGTNHVYGIPEHADRLSLSPTRGHNNSRDPYRLYNVDVFKYELNSPMSLYGAIPFMLGHNEHRSTGIFWLNAAETWIDIWKQDSERHSITSLLEKRKNSAQTETHCFSETGLLGFYVIMGRRPTDVVRKYGWLTGS